MWLLTVVSSGAVVPHAPVLLPEVSPGSDADTSGIRAAMEMLDLGAPDIVVLLSPHGERSGIYAGAAGRLDSFGAAGVEAHGDGDEGAARTLAHAWGRPLLEQLLDHGAVVPLTLLDLPAPVVVAALAETTGPRGASLQQVLDDAASFADALAALDMDVAFVASVNTSAGLSPRAPLTELPGAADVEEGVLAALRADPGALKHLAGALHERAGSCGSGPLAAVATLFAGGSGELLAYDAPFGVGYPVARLTARAR